MELVPRYFDPTVRGRIVLDGLLGEAITELLKLPFDFIFFTGSTKVGKIVMRAAAENLTPVLLELGGQNPALVDETANITDAARKIVWGAMAWGGQWCTSPGYAYVHESVADVFVAEARKTVVERQPLAPEYQFRLFAGRSAHGKSPDLRGFWISRKSSQADSPIRRHDTLIRRSSIPSRGTIQSWKTRCSARFYRFSPIRRSTRR